MSEDFLSLSDKGSTLDDVGSVPQCSGGKGLLFGGLDVFALLGGYFAYGSMVQSGLSSRVEAVRSEAEGFGLRVPSAPYDEDSFSGFEFALASKRAHRGDLESLISSVEVSGGRFMMGCLPSDGE